MKPCLATFLLLLCIIHIPSTARADCNYTTYYHGDCNSMKIAITVDDLYEPVNLKRILDLCLKYDIRVTFFTLGIVIHPENAALWQRIVDEGHEIGNHTYGHLNITDMTDEQFKHQLTITQDALNAVLREPYTMRLFRPPYGRYNRYGCVRKLKELGYPYMILWSVGLEDVQRTYKSVKGGSIILFHTNWQDVKCLEENLPKLLDAGFEPVTVSELLDLPPAMETKAGE
ncbi:MAG: polysaccharide deacetylase family protein [Clostridiales bacterium]|nr:polysaccharide deacetylase family protein [Clostridiales bacterium]